MSTSQPKPAARDHDRPGDPPAVHLGHQVGRFMRQVGLLRSQMAKHEGDGIEWSAYSVLFHLVSTGAIRPSALAEAMCADPSTVSRQVAALIEHDLVERQADPDDRRAARLVATKRGQAALARKQATRDALFAKVLAEWSAEDVRRLTALLGRFTSDLERSRPGLLNPHSAPPGQTLPSETLPAGTPTSQQETA
jgi:DNA-binding MarR family transcriptional regulator